MAQTGRGAILLDVVDVSGKTKDRAFIVNFMVSAIERLAAYLL